MYQALMVDDEVIALEAMKQGIAWEKLGITRTFQATNIAREKQLLNEQLIDVVICDIEMPNGSGIDLVQWLTEYGKDSICIFLTCHSEFSYAKSAIELGVLDYLLKPVDYQELEQVIAKAIQKRKHALENARARVILSEVSKGASPKEEQSKNAAMAEAAKQYIRENISRDLSVVEVAEHVFLNPDYLSRVFKRETGYTLKEYILKMRMGIACELLAKTSLSVSKVAMSCGYSHMAHFSQMFKKENGMTPNEYRARFQ